VRLRICKEMSIRGRDQGSGFVQGKFSGSVNRFRVPLWKPFLRDCRLSVKIQLLVAADG